MSSTSEADSPDARFGVDDLIAGVRAEAHRRDGSLKALLAAGCVADGSPEVAAIRHDVDRLDAAVLFLERLKPFLPDFRAYLRGRRFSQGRRG